MRNLISLTVTSLAVACLALLPGTGVRADVVPGGDDDGGGAGGEDGGVARPTVRMLHEAKASNPTGQPHLVYELEVRFSEPVTGFDATDLDIAGATTITSPTASESDSVYTVDIQIHEGDAVNVTIAIAANAVSSTSTSEGNDAGDLAFTVDNKAPVLAADGATVSRDSIVLEYDEVLSEEGAHEPDPSVYTVTVMRSSENTGGQQNAMVRDVRVRGDKVYVLLQETDSIWAGETVTLAYTNTTDSPRLRDLAGNHAAAIDPAIDVTNLRTLERPGAVQNLTATGLNSDSIKIDWDPPADDGGSMITGYRIQASNDGGSSYTVLRSSSTGSEADLATEYLHDGLEPDETWHYLVSAINGEGEGTITGTSATTKREGTEPDAPSLTATPVGATAIRLNWQPPTNTGTSAISSYEVEYSTDGGSNFTDLVTTSGTTTTHLHEGLQSNTTYHYRVLAVNNTGPSDWSNVAIQTTGTATTVPDPPTGLSATAQGHNQINLSWTAPANTGGANITGYRIERSADGNAWNILSAITTSGAGTTYSDTGLDPATTRHYRVYAVNSVGQSANFAGPVSAMTPAARPGRPTGLRATAGDGRIDLRWTAPTNNGGSAVNSYRIEESLNAGASWQTVDDSTASTATHYPHTGLPRGATRHYRVSAWNGVGVGDPSNTASATTPDVPDSPANLTATPNGQTEMILNWQAPDSNGSSIDGYRIDVSSNGGQTFTTVVPNSNSEATTFTHTGLTAATTWHYRVFAINGIGRGPASNIAFNTTGAREPDAPTNLTATTSGRSRIDLEWDPPGYDGGSNITGYRIEYREDAGTTWRELATHDTTRTSTRGADTGLNSGTTRHYRVRALNAVGPSEPSNVDSATTAPNRPGAPRDLSATAAGMTSIELSWSPPASDSGSAVTQYRIEVSGTGNADDWESAGATAETSFLDEGLEADTRYYYRVLAVNAVGPGPWSRVVNARTAPRVPDAPTGLTATAISQTRIDLDWDRPAYDGGSPVTGYRVEFSEDEGASWSKLAGHDTTRTVTRSADTGLDPGTTRHYRVRAINAAGAGDPSNEDHATTHAIPPDAPTNLNAMANGPFQIDLSWTAPGYDGGSAITGYRIEKSDDGGSNWSDLATTGVTTTHSDTGLDPVTTRSYRVYAINDAGESASPSNEASATTPAARPGRPTGLSANAQGTSQINLSWTAPSNNGGAMITGYRIEASEDGSSGWVVLEASAPATPTTFEHGGLDPATTRHYRVSATNAAGETGDPSNVANATTDATTPDAPTGLSATADGTTRIDLAWTAPDYDGGAAVTGYRIEVSVDAGANWRILVFNSQSTATTYTHPGLRPATTRHYRVSAINSAGAGPTSNEAHATTDAAIPASPTDLEATANGPFQIDLAWTAPNFDGGSAITGYRIEVSITRGASWSTLVENTGSTSTSYSHEGLPAATRRDYRVSAHNAVGASLPSNEVHATTDADLPDAPTGLTATARGSTRIDLAWTAPAYTGGVQITGYRIEVSDDGVSDWRVLVANADPGETRYTHMHLAPASTRHYRVSAINAAGVGDASDEASATTDAIVPDAPTGLAAAADGTSRIDLAWSAPNYDGGAGVSGYRIEVSVNGGVTWTDLEADTRSTTTAYAHTGLAPATTRHYRVSAINRIGAGDPSNVAHATTDATVPNAPQGLTADAFDHSRIDLRWSAPNFDGGSAIIGYRIEVSENEGATWADLVANTRSTDIEYSHTGLRPASTRHYRVSAVNGIGTGIPSNVADATTDAVVPDAPTDLEATATEPTRIDLTWTAPAYDGGAPVTSYRIEVSEDGNAWTDLQRSTGSTTTTYAHVGLRPGSTRFYRVSAINVAGTGNPSNVAFATTDDPVERAGRVNEAVLPHFAAAMNTSTMSAIAGRIETVASRNPLDSQLRAAGLLQRAATMDLHGSGLDLARVFDGASFATALGGGAQQQNGGTPAGFTTWGSAEYTSMGEPSGDEVVWDGSMLSIHLGADMRVHRDVLAGIAGTRSSGNYDFTDGTGAREVEGTYRARMTSLNPYLAWLPGRTGVSVWAAGSYGWGEVEVEDDPGGLRTSDATLRTGAVGGGRILVRSGSNTLRVRGEGWMSQVQVEGGEDMDSLTLDMHRLRLAVEWSQTHRVMGGHEVGLMLESGLRYGDGDGTEGSGMEIGGGMRYTSASKALTLEGHGRLLATSPNDYEEWGFRGLIQVNPQAVNRGLSLRIVPTWGESASGVQELWERGVSNRGDMTQVLGKGRVNTRLEYGLGDFGGTPYGRFYLADGGARSFGTGMKYEITRVLDMRFEGTRTESASGPARHGLAMRGRWVF